MLSRRYPRMYEIFGAYFNQDYDIWGETIEEIVECYKRDSSSEHCRELIGEIDKFICDHPSDLDSAFERDYGDDFDPQLWGHTAISFLEELKRLLTDSAP